MYVLLALLLLGGIAAVYWHNSGRVSLVGEVKDSVVSLSPGISGVFSRIEIREGQRVVRGQPLMSLDASAQQREKPSHRAGGKRKPRKDGQRGGQQPAKRERHAAAS